jgi:succinate-acetate transporter protein
VPKEQVPPAVQSTRPLATPLPMGFLGLVMASTLFGVLQVGWLSTSQSTLVALGVLVFAVPLQACSSIFGLLARDPVAGTGSGILAGTWAATTAISLVRPHPTTHPALGVLLIIAAAALLVPASAGFGKLVAALVLTVAAVRFALTGVYELTDSRTWMAVAGWVGLVTGAVALYGALAFELEGVLDRAALPTGRKVPVQDQGPVGVRPQV